jgi:hypothetical protein
MKITKFRLAHLDALVGEAAALGESGKAGLVRRVEGVSAVFDSEAWQAAKVKLEAWLEDFPEERGRWSVLEGEEALKVETLLITRPSFADVSPETGHCQCLWVYQRSFRGRVAIPILGSRTVKTTRDWTANARNSYGSRDSTSKSFTKSPIRGRHKQRHNSSETRHSLHERICCALASILARQTVAAERSDDCPVGPARLSTPRRFKVVEHDVGERLRLYHTVSK